MIRIINPDPNWIKHPAGLTTPWPRKGTLNDTIPLLPTHDSLLALSARGPPYALILLSLASSHLSFPSLLFFSLSPSPLRPPLPSPPRPNSQGQPFCHGFWLLKSFVCYSICKLPSKLSSVLHCLIYGVLF